MIQEIVSVELPVKERIVIRKNHLEPEHVRGNEKRISIVTGTHGDELDGQSVCYELVRQLNEQPQHLKGIVDIYPSVNPLGMDTGNRGIPMFDLDMNRVFPGDKNGAMAEYVAAGIVDDIIGSDLCIDIHSSNIFIKEVPQVRINEESAGQLLDYAKMLNADFVWIYSSITVLGATLAYSLNNMGVPTLVVEMGVGHRISSEYCGQLIKGIFHLLEHLGIWEDAPIPVKTPIISTEGQVKFIHAQDTGVFLSAIPELGPIRAGTTIGDVVCPMEGKVLQHVVAPSDGIIFTMRENPVVYQGALLARIYEGRKE